MGPWRCLFPGLKSWSTWGASCHPGSRRQVLLFVPGAAEWNENARWILGFIFLISLPASEVAWFSACGVLLIIMLMVVGFCSFRKWCFSGWWVCDLRTIAQFQRSEMSVGLLQDCHKSYLMMLRVLLVITEHIVVAAIAGYWSKRSQFDSHRWPISVPCFTKFAFRSSGAYFWSKVRTWTLRFRVQLSLEWNTCFAYQFWYCELCVKNVQGGGRKPYF